ncbi:hypothetical protein EU523_00375 [Candidatus Heimdallarchaeota archaeon]|nr:MAG: hypothetical protein EU523_00375 [Candidatus Heimdallarchaeota archaeon]
MARKYYRSISLPDELIGFVEKLIEQEEIKERHAYSSVADFFKDAARRRIAEIEEQVNPNNGF